MCLDAAELAAQNKKKRKCMTFNRGGKQLVVGYGSTAAKSKEAYEMGGGKPLKTVETWNVDWTAYLDPLTRKIIANDGLPKPKKVN